MPKLAANLTFLWNELDFIDRFRAAKAAGFTAVEYMFPYPYPKEQLAERLSTHGLKQVAHNLPAGDWAKGDRGIACDPARVGEFQEGVGRAIEYARALDCDRVNCLAGIPPSNLTPAQAHDTLVSNVRFAAGTLGAAKIKLMIEPVNTFDIPGFFVRNTKQALDIIKESGSSNAYVQYDIYHAQRMEGELANTLKANLPRIAHVQIADNPGRNEPGTGEINYRFLFGVLDAIGYDGWLGCEYKPKGTTDEGLGWRKAHGL